ncbi:hypothetical protein JG687_00016789 [Phytophthora cactorum]|uniref:Uncharacterized protein n=1 Tax=Phytophthora cactorum TaxID=29920 RepID=A0A8T1TR40_9STRA|nr:hypothetical protein JG687_00016789 [Phytophthora cactorum]
MSSRRPQQVEMEIAKHVNVLRTLCFVMNFIFRTLRVLSIDSGIAFVEARLPFSFS